MDHTNTPLQPSRRQFLKTSSGVALLIGSGGLLPTLISCENTKKLAEAIAYQDLTAWVQIAENGLISIFNPAAEMGQGSMTALPLIFAEEMDADWEKIRVGFSPQVPEIYGSSVWGPGRKGMLTAGSRTVYGYYSVMRQAGAQARFVLMSSVASEWGVPIEELDTEPGYVIQPSTGNRISYGAIVPILQIPESIPTIGSDQLKDPSDFRLIGQNVPRYDIPEKVNGQAQFAIDIRLPDMLYAVIERGRTHGAKPQLQNEEQILQLPGVQKVQSLDHGIGIIAATLEQALSAKEQLIIQWDKPLASGLNSQELYTQYEQVAKDKKNGRLISEQGNFSAAQRRAQKTYTLAFKNDYVYHAQMEPLNAIVQVAEDGQSAEVWVGSQQGFTPKMGVPKVLGLKPDQVKVNLQYLGGGLGRRSMTDYVEECASLAKEVAPHPLKLIWTREDDLTYGAYRPISLQKLDACLDQDGQLSGLSHLVIGDGDNLVASGIRNQYYNIPNQHAEIRSVKQGVRLKHWRAVGHGPNKFAIESMIDFVARDQEADPIDFRRRLMKESPRALATLEKVAEMSNWEKVLPANRAKGVAFLERSGTLSSGVCEISLDRTTGKIKVHHFWSAHDAGVVIQPDNVKAQVEGGIIMGISSALKERLTIENGKVVQSNFNDYQLLRFQDIPETIETAIIPSAEAPQGVGESGTPLVACAIANAFFALTGKQLLHLPFTPERVIAVLEEPSSSEFN